ncbi:MFS transporter [Halogeometricum sp. S1BR25-6]|uniref:MFS transporter n=1 Tax=Halogeometricum salsisoli TaxID=2950536 RepID=A0ABU2GBL4_9EURY|nr:MFS transporter [Halogeometricum sp. S1BR25-6]MDS0298190.1 MFS transporter [Halogeometricum sp. S1BR25-6]
MTTNLISDELSVPWRSRTVQAVLSSTLLAPFSVTLISPGLPVYRRAFGVTDAEASLLLSAVLIPGVVLSPVAGLLADRLGRRRVLVASLLVWSVTGAAVTLRPAFWSVVALRLAQGAALAGIIVTTISLIGDSFEGVRRNAVLGINAAVLSAGAAVYPLVGGALVVVAWNAPFALYLLGLPVAFFAARVLDEPLLERRTRSLAYLRRVVTALSAKDAAVLYGSALVIELLLFGAMFTGLPFLLAGTYGLSPLRIGLVVTVSEVASMVTATQNGRLAARFSDERIIAVGFVVAAAGLVGAWVAPTPLFLTAAMVGFGGGWGLTLPSIDAGVSDLVPAQFRAGALSFRGSATFLGRALGPLLFAGIGLRTGYRPLFLFGGVGAFAFGAALLAATR